MLILVVVIEHKQRYEQLLASPTRIEAVVELVQMQRSRPRKKPIQSRAQSTVTAIVEAAARILEGDGHAGFNTNAVAEVAGVSIGTLYQYFPDKNAIIGALIGRETAQLIAEVEAASTLSDGYEGLDGIISAAIRHQLRRPRLARVLDFEESVLPLDIETRRVRSQFEAAVAQCVARPNMPMQHNPMEAAADITAIIKGLIDAAGERGEKDYVSLGQRVRKAVLGYLDG